MAMKNLRNMKICGQSGYKYKTVPAITLKGKWLEVRYQNEKAEITARYVAEQSEGCYGRKA